MSKKPKRRPGRPPKSGAYSLAYQDEMIAQCPELRTYLLDVRAGLIRDLGPTEDDLTTGQLAIVDRYLNKLKIARVIELYFVRHGILDRTALGRKQLSAEPILSTWISLNNSMLRHLQALGIEKRQAEKVLDIRDYIKEFDRSKAKDATMDTKPAEIVDPGASGCAQDGQGDKSKV